MSSEENISVYTADPYGLRLRNIMLYVVGTFRIFARSSCLIPDKEESARLTRACLTMLFPAFFFSFSLQLF